MHIFSLEFSLTNSVSMLCTEVFPLSLMTFPCVMDGHVRLFFLFASFDTYESPELLFNSIYTKPLNYPL